MFDGEEREHHQPQHHRQAEQAHAQQRRALPAGQPGEQAPPSPIRQPGGDGQADGQDDERLGGLAHRHAALADDFAPLDLDLVLDGDQLVLPGAAGQPGRRRVPARGALLPCRTLDFRLGGDLPVEQQALDLEDLGLGAAQYAFHLFARLELAPGQRLVAVGGLPLGQPLAQVRQARADALAFVADMVAQQVQPFHVLHGGLQAAFERQGVALCRFIEAQIPDLLLAGRQVLQDPENAQGGGFVIRLDLCHVQFAPKALRGFGRRRGVAGEQARAPLQRGLRGRDGLLHLPIQLFAIGGEGGAHGVARLGREGRGAAGGGQLDLEQLLLGLQQGDLLFLDAARGVEHAGARLEVFLPQFGEGKLPARRLRLGRVLDGFRLLAGQAQGLQRLLQLGPAVREQPRHQFQLDAHGVGFLRLVAHLRTELVHEADLVGRGLGEAAPLRRRLLGFLPQPAGLAEVEQGILVQLQGALHVLQQPALLLPLQHRHAGRRRGLGRRQRSDTPARLRQLVLEQGRQGCRVDGRTGLVGGGLGLGGQRAGQRLRRRERQVQAEQGAEEPRRHERFIPVHRFPILPACVRAAQSALSVRSKAAICCNSA